MEIQKKVLIFDFDGVFYSGEHKFDKVKEFLDLNKPKFLPNLSSDEYNLILQENPEWISCDMGSKIVDLLYYFKNKYPQFNISTQAFIDWQNNSVYPLVIDNSQIIDANLMEELCKNFAVYVVSNSSKNHIEFYMKKFKIKKELFKEIISNNFEESCGTKKYYYKKILQLENVKPNNVYVFGDTIKTDIEPAKELGMNTFFIERTNDINLIINSKIYKN